MLKVDSSCVLNAKYVQWFKEKHIPSLTILLIIQLRTEHQPHSPDGQHGGILTC